MDEIKPFMGTGMLIWYADGKLKHHFINDQDQFTKELERIQKNVSPRSMLAAIINWEEQNILDVTQEFVEEEKAN